jgi:hypothetical protein
MVRRISPTNSCKRSQVDWTGQSSPRGERLALGAGNRLMLFRREQTSAGTVVSLHVGVGVILTAKAPNRRRSSRAFGGRDDAGPRSPNTRERQWTRPHCSLSSSWCCCSAAADSSTDAGLESEGRFARRDHSSLTTRTPRSHGLSSALRRGGPSARQRATSRDRAEVSRGARRSGGSC